jgi:hypothetical protein
MKQYLILMLTIIVIACNNNDSSNNTDDTVVEIEDFIITDNEAPSVSGCYLRVIQRDSLAASLTQDGNLITGRLTFDNFEKDGSTGTVTGSIDKDILKLVYRFQSEGMNSIAEVYFKITANGLIHGNGEIKVKGDSAYYASPDKVIFEPNELLNKISCDSLLQKYR